MEYKLTAHKLSPNTHLIKNKITNQPVAVLTAHKDSWGGRVHYSIDWHPSFKQTYPEVDQNLLTRNFTVKPQGVPSGVDHVTRVSEYIVTGQHNSSEYKDPIKVKYAGVFSDPKNEKVKIHKWRVLDDDSGETAAHITSRVGPDQINAQSEVDVTLMSDYLNKYNIGEHTRDAASKRHSGRNLRTAMYRVRYLMDNKSKEPRFIGSVTDASGSTIYKTKLEPEHASSAFETHLKNQMSRTPDSKYTFTRHSPTMFSIDVPNTSLYSQRVMHHVTATPGELHHIVTRFGHPDHSSSKSNSVVESAVRKNYHILSLENFISLYQYVNGGGI